MSLLFANLAFLIPLVPIIASFICIFFGSKIDTKAYGNIIAFVALATSFAIALLVVGEVLVNLIFLGEHVEDVTYKATLLTLINIESATGGHPLKIEFGVLVDPLSSVVLLMVTFLAFMVAFYSRSYMAHDGSPRYYAEINMFAAAMMALCLSPNLIQMFIGWEIMGVCSYLLIGYYYEKEEVPPGLPHPASASKKAFLTTKVGDILLFAGIILLYLETHTFDFHELLEIIEEYNTDPVLLALIGVLMFGGAVGKSAQFPLHVWLPDAMAGPTTVSCLIHSATMVKAGIFLIARNYFIFEAADETALLIVAVIGGITAIMAGTIALVKTDIKGVLAYSTISQLGYMTIGLGVGGMPVAIFHVINHGLFKALLFLSAGSVIHGAGTQDIRQMGGLKEKMPKTWKAMLVGSLSLAGIGNGFFSKDAIIAEALHHWETTHNTLILLVWLSSVITAFLTAFYIFRLWFTVFLGENRHPDPDSHVHESDSWMTTPLYLIAGTTIVLAIYFTIGIIIPDISFEHYLFHWLMPHETAPDFNFTVAGTSLVLAAIGIGIAYLVYNPEEGKITFPEGEPSFVITGKSNFMADTIRKIKMTTIGRYSQKILENGYYIDNLYMAIAYNLYHNKFCGLMNWIETNVFDNIVRFLAFLGYSLCGVSKWFDDHIVDGTVRKIASLSVGLCGLAKTTDERIIDNGIVRNIGRFFVWASSKLRWIHTGIIENYALYSVIGAIMIIVITVFFQL